MNKYLVHSVDITYYVKKFVLKCFPISLIDDKIEDRKYTQFINNLLNYCDTAPGLNISTLI